MLARVDLDLELQGRGRLGLGRKAEHEVHRVPGLFALALAQPGECVADGIDRRADRFGFRLHKVDVFRVAQRLLEEQLVDRGSTAEGHLASQCWRVEEVAQCAADDQILLYLRRVRPGRAGSPGLDVRLRDQASTSMVSFSSSFHVGSRNGASANAGTSGLTPGSSGAKCLADSANECSARACLRWPACSSK